MSPLHGWLVLDKPLGITSAKAVAIVKRVLKPQKIGHAGTLDPLASGILPLALGEATKTVSFIMGAQKSYRFTVAWGQERATDDAEGEVVAESENRPSLKEIEALIPQFMGIIEQLPPAYSALKVEGKRAYAMARAGEEVILQPRTITVYDLTLISENPGVDASFEVSCGKGTYIRSIARDMGRKLGCHGYVSHLRRTAVGEFSENNAISLDLLEELVHSRAPVECIMPLESALDDILAFPVDKMQSTRLRRGQTISCPLADNDSVAAMEEGKLVAMGVVNAGIFRPARVFNH